MSTRKRIFLSGVKDISVADLEGRFSDFGKISNVEFISQKHFPIWYFDLEGSEELIGKCLKVYNKTKWKGSLIRMEEANEHYSVKLERERMEARKAQSAEQNDSLPKKIISKKKLKRKANQHAENMDLVTRQRKGWVNTRHNRLVCKIKMRFPTTGRETVIDPMKYQLNWKKFDTPRDIDNSENVSVMDLHFTNDGMQDLSKDALQITSEKSRKRAGIWTSEELALARKCSKAIKAEEAKLAKEIKKSGISKKKYFGILQAEQMLNDEKANVKSLAQSLASKEITLNDGEKVIEFNDEDDLGAANESLKDGIIVDGLFALDSEEEEQAHPESNVSLQSKMALFDDDSD